MMDEGSKISQITVELLDHMGTDLSVVNSARVSFNKKSVPVGYIGSDENNMRPALHYSDEKLIKYLATHKHFSPFGHCFATFHVKAPIFVARQLVKHSYLRINEVSRRYVKTEPEIFYPENWRETAVNKKQGSGGTVAEDIAHKVMATTLQQCNQSVAHYKTLLGFGVCEEQARMVLPANLFTEFWWSGSLDAFAKMAVLRCAPDSQKETQIVANLISKDMSRLFPISWRSLITPVNLQENAKEIA
tara:strand:- start:894 stop:1631 length:738 start_codon:yes stop_codon:yes gene_type:complete